MMDDEWQTQLNGNVPGEYELTRYADLSLIQVHYIVDTATKTQTRLPFRGHPVSTARKLRRVNVQVLIETVDSPVKYDRPVNIKSHLQATQPPNSELVWRWQGDKGWQNMPPRSCDQMNTALMNCGVDCVITHGMSIGHGPSIVLFTLYICDWTTVYMRPTHSGDNVRYTALRMVRITPLAE